MSAPRFSIALVAAGSLVACASILGADFDHAAGANFADATTEMGDDAASADAASLAPSPLNDAGGCDADRKSCGGQCVSKEDPRYGCGAAACEACVIPSGTATCTSGQCAISSCDVGRGDCDLAVSNGCEVDFNSAHDHCGSCSTPCSSEDVCSVGKCGLTCESGMTDCGGSCVDTSSDPAHCGSCQSACNAPAHGTSTCNESTCGFTCVGGYVVSGSVCACSPQCAGIACGGDDSCGGACPSGACPNGQRCADSTCICDTISCTGCCTGSGSCAGGTTDAVCGTGGQMCSTCAPDSNGSGDCTTGTCKITCAAGYSACSGGQCCPNKIIFVTETTYTGNLGGLTGADALCGAAAAAGHLTGTFKAWLSSSTVSAASRLTHSTGAYQLPTGEIVATSWSNLLANGPHNAIDSSETLNTDIMGAVFTGTTVSGTSVTPNCTDWTSGANAIGAIYGLPNFTSSLWTSSGTNNVACDNPSHLYCVEQ